MAAHKSLALCSYSLLLLLGCITKSCTATAVVRTTLQPHEFSSSVRERQLRAASPSSDIAKRGLEIPLRAALQLHYIDDALGASKIPMGAQVHLESDAPVLLLEEIDHLVEEIHCGADFMDIKFASRSAMQMAEAALRPLSELLIITSHWSCNDHGSRLPFAVSKQDFLEDTNTIKFSTIPVSWEQGFRSMTVEFGPDSRDLTVGQHDHLRRRSTGPPVTSAISSATAGSTSTSSPNSTINTNIIFPTPPSSARPTATSVVKDVGAQLIDTQILPLVGNALLADVEGHILPAGLTLTCVNCTVVGQVELLSGSFKVGSRSNHTILAVKNFVEDGFADIIANGLFAHIELLAAWTASIGVSFTVNLATIPLQPFSIPNVAVIGPLFQPRLLLNVDVSRELDFNFGFEVTVPDNSTALASLNVTRSTLTGFQNSSFTLLPFNSAIQDLVLTLTATLQPEVLIGFSLLDGSANAGVGLFFELPQLSLAISQVSGKDLNCEDLANNTLANDIFGVVGNLTHVVPGVEIAGGFLAQATLGLSDNNFQTAWTPVVTNFAPPTACLAFDQQATGYASASAVASSVSAASSASAASAAKSSASATSTSAAHRVNIVTTDGQRHFLTVQMAVVLLAMISGGFWVL